MSALTLLLIRHAEKPDDPPDKATGPGLTAAGATDPHSLIIGGWQRAGAWAALFGAGLGGPEYPRPGAVYAAADVKPDAKKTDGEKHASARPMETVTPLAARLGLAVQTPFPDGAEAEMARTLLGLSGTVLVCWEHKALIGELVPAILAGQHIPGLPTKWAGNRFDVVLRFDRATRAAPWSYRQLSPMLLAGDRATPVDQG